TTRSPRHATRSQQRSNQWRALAIAEVSMPFDGPDGYVTTLLALARLFRARRPLSVVQWTPMHRILSSKTAAEPGPWNPDRVPQLNGPMAALDYSHPAPVVVLVGGSQNGKSEVALNWIGCTMHQRGGSILCLSPTEKVARKFVRTRF